MGVGRLECVHGKDARGSTVTGIRIMTIDEMMTVLKAAKEGKAIEHRDAFNAWRMCNPSVPNDFLFYGSNEYRVAPEPRKPREFVLMPNCTKDGWYVMPPDALAYPINCIRVREVIE